MFLSWSPSDGVIRRLFSAALAVVLAFAMVVIVPEAQATSHDSNSNSVAFWCGTEDGGTKIEPVDDPFIVPEPPVGYVWWLLVLKAGSGPDENKTFPYPTVGQGYSHSDGSPANSHAILCKEFEPDPVPGIDIEKSTNDQDADTPTGPSITVGHPVTWTYVVTNTGQVDLTGIVVTDDQGVTPVYQSGDTGSDQILGLGEVWIYEATGVAVIGQYANEGTVVGSVIEGPTVTDKDLSHYVGVTTENQCPFGPKTDRIFIDIIGETGGFLWGAPNKSPSQLGPIAAVVPAGTYRVSWASWDEHSEHGGQNQTQEQWYLDVGGAISVDTEDVPEDQNFIQGVLGTDLVVGSPATSVTIHHGGQPDTTNSVFAICAALDPLVPGIDIEKSTNGQDADTPTGPSITVGHPVTWTYVVTNTGQVDLTGIVVTDDQGVTPVYQSGDTGSDQILGLGEVWIYEATGVAVIGQYANEGTVVGSVIEGPTVTDKDLSHYVGVTTPPPPTPGIDIEKSTNGEDANAAPGPSITIGDPVTWTYVVTNTGQVHLTGVIVTDDILGDVCTIGDLAIGASATCTLTGTAVAGQYANVGTATDNNGNGSTVIDTDPSHYFGQAVLASGTIGDTVWSDENDNGIQDNGEKGIAGATVRLTLPDGTTIQMNTNANGLYLFSGLEAGAYKSELILSSIPDPAEGSLKLTTAGSFTIQLADGESFLDADFGVVAALPKTGISSDRLALIALVLLAAGTLAVFTTRRRQDDIGEGDIAA